MADKKKITCPNCQGVTFQPIYNPDHKRVEGQKRCSNCGYVVSESE